MRSTTKQSRAAARAARAATARAVIARAAVPARAAAARTATTAVLARIVAAQAASSTSALVCTLYNSTRFLPLMSCPPTPGETRVHDQGQALPCRCSLLCVRFCKVFEGTSGHRGGPEVRGPVRGVLLLVRAECQRKSQARASDVFVSLMLRSRTGLLFAPYIHTAYGSQRQPATAPPLTDDTA